MSSAPRLRCTPTNKSSLLSTLCTRWQFNLRRTVTWQRRSRSWVWNATTSNISISSTSKATSRARKRAARARKRLWRRPSCSARRATSTSSTRMAIWPGLSAKASLTLHPRRTNTGSRLANTGTEVFRRGPTRSPKRRCTFLLMYRASTVCTVEDLCLAFADRGYPILQSQLLCRRQQSWQRLLQRLLREPEGSVVHRYHGLRSKILKGAQSVFRTRMNGPVAVRGVGADRQQCYLRP